MQEDTPDQARCRRCGAEKHRSEFTAADGICYLTCNACREKVRRNHRARRAVKPDEGSGWADNRRTWHLSHYGITDELYDRLLVAQNGVCATCRRECTSGRRLAVDHDHRTGRVRGLLCAVCNRMLGVYEAFHQQAAAYLAANGGGHPLLDGAGVHTPLLPARGLRNVRITEQQAAEIRSRYSSERITQKALAAEMGVSVGTVSSVVREARWTSPEARNVELVKELVARRRKLSDADIADVRVRHENGESARSIGRSLGVAHTTIRDIVSGRTWKNI